MQDIRNKEITIKVKADEDTITAVTRYMKKKGFTHFMKTAKSGMLEMDAFYSDDYSELWIGCSNYNESTSKITFELTGNR